MRLITIEFTQDTFREELDESGETVQVPVRSKGERVHVDARSAKSLVDKKGVAIRVGTTTDDDRSNDQVPVQDRVVGDVDTPPSETDGANAGGDQPTEQAASTPRSRRGSANS